MGLQPHARFAVSDGRTRRRDEVESKFRGYARTVMSADQASRVIRSIESLATGPNL